MASSVSSWDDEDDLRTRAMQGVAGPCFVPPPSTRAAPPGLSPVSSLAEVSNKEGSVPQHRPLLSPPTKNTMYRLLDAHMELERLTAKSADLFAKDVNACRNYIDQLETEKQEVLVKEAQAVSSQNTWSTLSLIAQYASGVGMIVLGVACGGAAAALLIASGVVGLGNRLLHDTRLLQVAVEWWTKSEELQKKLTHNIEMGALFLQLGLGLAGGFAAWQAGALSAARNASTLEVVKKAGSIITTASGVMGAGARVGMEFYRKRIAHLEADMKTSNYHMTIKNHEISESTQAMSRMLQTTESETEELQKALRALEVSLD